MRINIILVLVTIWWCINIFDIWKDTVKDIKKAIKKSVKTGKKDDVKLSKDDIKLLILIILSVIITVLGIIFCFLHKRTPAEDITTAIIIAWLWIAIAIDQNKR